MSDSPTDTFTVSFKTGVGYDASLIVVRGNTIQELIANTEALHALAIEVVVDTENLVHAMHAAKRAGADSPALAPPAFAQPEAAPYGGGVAVPGPEPRQAQPVAGMICAHGKRTRREGNSSKGAWVGHFCPLRKGDPAQCSPVFE